MLLERFDKLTSRVICRCKEHKIGLELYIRAFEQDLAYILFTYGFLVPYNRLWQPYLEFEFARANLNVVIFKEISGSCYKSILSC